MDSMPCGNTDNVLLSIQFFPPGDLSRLIRAKGRLTRPNQRLGRKQEEMYVMAEENVPIEYILAPQEKRSLKSILKKVYAVISFLSFIFTFVVIVLFIYRPWNKKLDELPIEKIDTKQFRVGIFLPEMNDKTLPAYYILRDSVYQTEIDAPKNLVRKFSITWINDAEYELTFLSSNNSRDSFKKGDKINVNILSGGDNFYKAVTRQKHGENSFRIYKILNSEYYLRPNHFKKERAK